MRGGGGDGVRGILNFNLREDARRHLAFWTRPGCNFTHLFVSFSSCFCPEYTVEIVDP